MLVRDVGLTHQIINELEPGHAWTAGALAGLCSTKPRDSWEWSLFIEELTHLIKRYTNLPPVEPGKIPIDEEGTEGSILDAIGGFVSVTGRTVKEGLHFRVYGEHIGHVAQLMSGIDLLWSDDGIIIPWSDVPRFCRRIPIKGPLLDIIEDRRGLID